MAIEAYRDQAEQLVTDVALCLLPCAAIIGGVFACKMVYELNLLVSSFPFKSYSRLPKFQQIEWNNRAMSTVHAILITVVSLYMVFLSDLFSDGRSGGPVISKFTLGVSVGYFLTDLGMIICFYPVLGGLEYVAHHLFSIVSVSYVMLSGEAQIYTFMVLISEITTAGINLRWYLDAAGMKQSIAYVINRVVVFRSWLVARIILFVYIFIHVCRHFDQVMQMHRFGVGLVMVVPMVLSVVPMVSSVMNLMWFLKKT